MKQEQLMDRMHALIHEASFELSQNNIGGAQELLREADQLSHELF